jgi:hypothetical protein
MARLNVVLCDFCKNISKTDVEPAKLRIVKGRGEDKINIQAEICDACLENFKKKIEQPVSLENLSKPQAAPGGLVTPIASRRRPTDLANCEHKRTEFRTPFIHCLDCGNQEKI